MLSYYFTYYELLYRCFVAQTITLFKGWLYSTLFKEWLYSKAYTKAMSLQQFFLAMLRTEHLNTKELWGHMIFLSVFCVLCILCAIKSLSTYGTLWITKFLTILSLKNLAQVLQTQNPGFLYCVNPFYTGFQCGGWHKNKINKQISYNFGAITFKNAPQFSRNCWKWNLSIGFWEPRNLGIAVLGTQEPENINVFQLQYIRIWKIPIFWLHTLKKWNTGVARVFSLVRNRKS